MNIILVLMFSVMAQASISIIGGEVVKDPKREAPFFVRVNDDCGGSLVATNFVLTAAHCVAEEKSVWVTDLDGHKVKSRKMIVHPLYKYQKKGIAYDFALIELPSPLSSAVIIMGEYELTAGQPLTSYGFGRISATTAEMSSVLKKLDEPFVPASISNLPESYNGMITESMFTAGYKEGGQSTCQADSGGPLVDRKTGKLVGIVSWGEGCAKPDKYSVYAKVSQVINWIEDILTR